MKSNLELKDGIWFSGKSVARSYPDNDSNDYFTIEDDSFWFKHRNDCILESVRQFPPNGMIYDVGGGNGYVSLGLESHGFPVTLIEPNVIGAINAKKRGLKRIICSTLEHSGLEKKSLGAIGLFDVLEHIEDDEKFLKNLQEYLKDDGRLYISVPAFNFLWSNEDNHAGHFRRYTLRSLIKVLKESGYSIDYATYFFSILPIPIFIFRNLPYRLGIKRRKTSSSEHKDHNKNTFFLESSLHRELNKIRKRGKNKFGSSCLVVAKSNF